MRLKKEHLLPAVVALVILVVGFGFLRTTITDIFSIREENAKREGKLERLQEKAQALLSLNDQELTQNVETVEKNFPSKKPVLQFISSIGNLAKEEDVSFRGVELGEMAGAGTEEVSLGKIPGKTEEMPITFMIVGALDKVFSFIGGLEKLPPVMGIVSFNVAFIEKGKEGEPIEKLSEAREVTVTIIAYYQEPPVSIGEIDTPLPTLPGASEGIFAKLDEFKSFPKIQLTAQTGKEDPFK